MYATENPKTKRQLKLWVQRGFTDTGSRPRAFQAGPFGPKDHLTGIEYIEGPHYPAPHSWYAKVQLRDGIIVKVIS